MAGRAKVVVADFIVESLDHERRVLEGVAEPVALQARHEDDLLGRVEDADALMLYHTLALTERTIGRLRRCQLIVRCGAGYDNVDVAAARRHGIPVANVPDYGTEEVADSALGLALLSRPVRAARPSRPRGASGRRRASGGGPCA